MSEKAITSPLAFLVLGSLHVVGTRRQREEKAAFRRVQDNSVSSLWRDAPTGLENSVFTPRITPTPLLMIVALEDELVPSEISLAAYQQALEPKKLVLLPSNHFTPYVEQFSLTGGEARDWFTRHLIIGGSVGLN